MNGFTPGRSQSHLATRLAAAVGQADADEAEKKVEGKGEKRVEKLHIRPLSLEQREHFVADWQRHQLPKEAWTHGAHVAACAYFAFDRDEAEIIAIRPCHISTSHIRV